MPKQPNMQIFSSRLEDDFEKIYTEFHEIKPYAYIHLAAMTNIQECEKNPTRAHQHNTLSPARFFNAAAKAGVPRFIFLSSSLVYAPSRDRLPLDVTSKTKPNSAYAKSKLDAEKELLLLSKDFESTKLCIVRLFSLLSKSMRPGFLLTNLTERAGKGDFSELQGLNYVRDFLWADEACKRLVDLALADPFPSVINLCSGSPTKIQDVAYRVFKKHGHTNFSLRSAPKTEGDIEYIVGKPTKF